MIWTVMVTAAGIWVDDAWPRTQWLAAARNLIAVGSNVPVLNPISQNTTALLTNDSGSIN